MNFRNKYETGKLLYFKGGLLKKSVTFLLWFRKINRAVVIVPTVAGAWYPHATIVPAISINVMKKEAIKGILAIPYTPNHTKAENADERGEIRAVKPR